jgi:hypothetical protein
MMSFLFPAKLIKVAVGSAAWGSPSGTMLLQRFHDQSMTFHRQP